MSTDKRKRFKKQEAIQVILTNFKLLHSGIPGLDEDPDAVAKAINLSGQFLYESEVDKVIEAQTAIDSGFEAEIFKRILTAADAIVKTAAPTIGEGQVLITSEERASEVANAPEDVPQIMEIMKSMTELRDMLKPLIDKHASCSIALKNKKVKEKKEDAGADATQTEANAPQSESPKSEA